MNKSLLSCLFLLCMAQMSISPIVPAYRNMSLFSGNALNTCRSMVKTHPYITGVATFTATVALYWICFRTLKYLFGTSHRNTCTQPTQIPSTMNTEQTQQATIGIVPAVQIEQKQTLQTYDVAEHCNGTMLRLNIKAGNTFTLELDEDRSTGPNYKTWSVIGNSDNITVGSKTFKAPGSTKVGHAGHAVFTFTAQKSGQASVTFGQRDAKRTKGPFDNQKTFNFIIK